MRVPATAYLRTAGRLLHNSPLTLSDAMRRWAADPDRLRLVVEQRLRRTSPVSASSPTDRQGVGRLIAAGQLVDAASALDAWPPNDPWHGVLTARLLRARGRLSSARDVASAAAASENAAPARAARRLASAIDSELTLLQPMPAGSNAPVVVAAQRGRILHVVTNSLPLTRAGYTIRTQQLVSAQREAGLDAQVVTRLGYPVTAGHLAAAANDVVDGVPYHHLLPVRALPRSPVARRVEGIDATEKLVRQLRPALVHAATDHVNGHTGLEVARRTGLPFAYEVRGFLEDSWLSRHADDPEADTSEAYLLARDAESNIMQQADLVTTLGEGMRQEIIARGVDPERVLVTANGVDQRFLRPDIDGGGVRARLGIAPTDFVVGLVSTFYEHEGISTLIDAVSMLRANGVAVRLLLAGHGQQESVLRAQVQRLGLDDVTSMPGWVSFDEIEHWYAALDVFCVPRVRSRVTDLVSPLKPIEAMAVARPLLASDVGGLREVVVPSGGGRLVAPDDPAAWADAINSLREDPTARAELGASGRAWVAENRTWAAVAQIYRAAYQTLGAA